MSPQRRPKILERALVLILLGVLAGGLGGLAIGIVTNRSASSSSSQ